MSLSSLYTTVTAVNRCITLTCLSEYVAPCSRLKWFQWCEELDSQELARLTLLLVMFTTETSSLWIDEWRCRFWKPCGGGVISELLRSPESGVNPNFSIWPRCADWIASWSISKLADLLTPTGHKLVTALQSSSVGWKLSSVATGTRDSVAKKEHVCGDGNELKEAAHVRLRWPCLDRGSLGVNCMQWTVQKDHCGGDKVIPFLRAVN